MSKQYEEFDIGVRGVNADRARELSQEFRAVLAGASSLSEHHAQQQAAPPPARPTITQEVVCHSRGQ